MFNKIMADYRCDKQSKLDYMASTTAYLSEVAPEWTVSWYGCNVNKDNNNKVITGITKTEIGKDEEQSNLDLIMEIKKDGYDLPLNYVIELKERLGSYTSDAYGNEGQEGWMYNVEKDSALRVARQYGYIPRYANVYPDGVCRTWNIEKCSKELKKFDVPNSTIEPEKGRAIKDRYLLRNDEAITYKRIRTNG